MTDPNSISPPGPGNGQPPEAGQLHFLWQLVDAIPSPLFWKDAQGRYQGCNRAFEGYVGIPRDQLIGKTVFDIAPPDLAPVYAAADQELFGRRGTQVYEAEVEYADGSRHRVVFYKAVLTGPDEKPEGLVGVMLDVTERRQAEEALRLSSIVFEKSAEGIILADRTGRILRVNRAFQEITGYGEGEVLGRTPGEVLGSGSQGREFYAELWNTLTSFGYWSGEVANRRRSGELYWERLSITRVDDPGGEPANYIGIFSDLTEARSARRKIEQLSYFDAITGLPNRVLLAERLASALGAGEGGLALISIDIGGLDQINDTLGHHCGDKLLLAAAQRLGELLPPSATAYRHAGHGFAVVSEESGPQAAGELAGRLLAALRQPFLLEGHAVAVTAHAGVSLHPGDGADGATLLKNADMALHAARGRGLGGFEHFREEMNQAAMERLLIETRMRPGLERGEFSLHYQPQVDLPWGRISGMEALLRWTHPELGAIPSSRFIPLAEESGFIVELGEWVLREACRAAQAMRSAGHPDIRVAVNVSPRQFVHEGFAGQVEAALAATGLPARCLELELTESLIMQRPQEAARVMAALKALGITFSVDDFGTGYSSLNQLIRFPIDKLKIDQSFIREIPESSGGAVVTRAVIALGHSLSLKIIAEGVETEEQKRFLSDNGCHCLQGYLFSRPLPEPAMAALLEAHRDRGRESRAFEDFSI